MSAAVAAAAADIWSREIPDLIFHDPLAAAAIFAPEVCAWWDGRVAVELAAPASMGMTTLVSDDVRPHRVAGQVDLRAFLAHYFGVLSASSSR
jgi:purine nucleosidase